MPKRNWRYFLAIGLAALLAVGTGGAIFLDASRSAAFYEQQAEKHAQTARDSGPIHAQRACASIPLAERAECQADEYNAARERERQEYDLQAQLVTSAWTRAMGLAALVATVISIVAVGLVYVTFRETRRTAEIADRNYRAFAKFESAVLVTEFVAKPTFFVERGKMHMSFMLKCTNAGRTSAFVSGLRVEGGGPALRYSFICKPDAEETFAKGHKVLVQGKTRIQGYVEYSSHVETGNRRRFYIKLTVKPGPAQCRATMHSGGVLRKGDEKYDKPFS